MNPFSCANDDDAIVDFMDAFQEGYLHCVTWNDLTLRQASLALQELHHSRSVLLRGGTKIEEIALVENDFGAGSSLQSLLQLLSEFPEIIQLKRLVIVAGDQIGSLLQDLAGALQAMTTTTTTTSCRDLPHLELVMRGRAKIRSAQTEHLSAILSSVTQSVSLSCTRSQKDYAPVLQAMVASRGQSSLSPSSSLRPRLLLRNVSFGSHEYPLHRFVAQLCHACQQEKELTLDTLQVNPRLADATLQAGNAFWEAMARILAFARVQHLEFPQVVMASNNSLDEHVLADLRHALATNTTLERLSLPCTRGCDGLWQRALFPALVQNQSVREISMAHDGATVTTFLQFLPQLPHLRRVQAPWTYSAAQGENDNDNSNNDHLLASSPWSAVLQNVETLCDVTFVEPPPSNNTSCTASSSSRPSSPSPTFQSAPKQVDLALRTVQALLQRNRYLAEARALLTEDENTSNVNNDDEEKMEAKEMQPKEDRHHHHHHHACSHHHDDVVISKLKQFSGVAADVGLSASYVLLRESLQVFS